MTDEELNKMIGEFLPYPVDGQHYALKQFASLVAAAEREACAKVCEVGTGEPIQMKALEMLRQERERIAKAIRARGKE